MVKISKLFKQGDYLCIPFNPAILLEFFIQIVSHCSIFVKKKTRNNVNDHQYRFFSLTICLP